MNRQRLGEVAGLAAVASILTLSAGSLVLGQPENPMNPATPTNPSRPSQPGTNPNTPTSPTSPTRPVQPGTTNPGTNNPITPPVTRTPADFGTGRRLFMAESNQESQIRDFGARLARMEMQMQATNERLTSDLADVGNMDTQQKVDRLTTIMQTIVLEHRQLHDYLVETRTALTGPVASSSNPNTMTPGLGTPATTPSTSPSTSPSPSPPVTPGTSPTTNPSSNPTHPR